MPRPPHAVPMPAWNLPVSYIKLILVIAILVFTAVCTSMWGDYVAFGFTLFTASATLFIFLYYLISLSFFSLSLNISLYNRWAVLGLEILQMVFWLISMVLLADWVQWHHDSQEGWYVNEVPPGEYGTTLYDEFSERAAFEAYANGKKYHTAITLAGISAALAGLEFVLFLISLVTFSTNLRQHRLADNPSVYEEEDHDAVPELVDSRTNATPTTNSTVMPGVMGISQTQGSDSREVEKARIRPPTPVEKARAAEAAREAELGSRRAHSLATSSNADVPFVLYCEEAVVEKK